MAIFTSLKTVLIMSDEGVQIFSARGNNVRFIDIIGWETEGFVEAVSDLLVKAAKKRPVIILNDMVEQHYRKENVPRVGLMDKANVVKRRLNIAFPNHRINAALKLKNAHNVGDGAKGAPHLFAAMPNSKSFRSLINAVQQSGASLEGVYLLPVEASAVVRSLSAQLYKKDRDKAMWTIFAGQHHSGGLRQIVVRNGELALTRMTPIVDTDVEPELWAKEVSSELSATMSYLSRFGYKETDGLRIIVISNEGLFDMLKQLNDQKGKLDVMTAAQASKLLGLRLGGALEQRYADSIYVAHLSKVKKFLLPMKSNMISRLSVPRKVASFIILLLLLVSGLYVFKAFDSYAYNLNLQDQLQIAQQERASIDQEYQKELRLKKDLGFDFKLVSDAISFFEDARKQQMEPLPVFREIGRALGPDLNLDNVIFKLEKNEVEDAGEYKFDSQGREVLNEDEFSYSLNGVLSLSFSSEIDPDLGVRAIDTLASRLQQNLPDQYTVVITKQVADLSYTGNFVGGEPQGQGEEDYFAEIQIQGPIK